MAAVTTKTLVCIPFFLSVTTVSFVQFSLMAAPCSITRRSFISMPADYGKVYAIAVFLVAVVVFTFDVWYINLCLPTGLHIRRPSIFFWKSLIEISLLVLVLEHTDPAILQFHLSAVLCSHIMASMFFSISAHHGKA